MGPSQCAVVKCFNNKRKLDKLLNLECDIHAGKRRADCSCPPPFRLYCFPGPKLYQDRRQRWVKLMKRTTAKNTPWLPKPSDRVCSLHFVDGEPTPQQHPDPSLHLGYDTAPVNPRRTLFRHPCPKRRRSSSTDDANSFFDEPGSSTTR